MRPIINMPEENRATDIGNMHKKLVKIARVVPEISCRTDRQRHTQTDALITILHNNTRVRAKFHYAIQVANLVADPVSDKFVGSATSPQLLWVATSKAGRRQVRSVST